MVTKSKTDPTKRFVRILESTECIEGPCSKLAVARGRRLFKPLTRGVSTLNSDSNLIPVGASFMNINAFVLNELIQGDFRFVCYVCRFARKNSAPYFYQQLL